jgi:hypothetical protein
MKWGQGILTYRNLVIAAVTLIAAFVLWRAIMSKKRANIISKIQKSDPGLMDISYLGRANLPRGIRNNNPGNLTRTAITWQNKVPHSQNTDTRFEQFRSFVWGLRAMLRDIRNDINLKGKNTIRELITEYAPPNENNTAGYINTLSTRTGIGADEVFTADKETVRKLAREICIIENGNPVSHGFVTWYDNAMFDAAWDLSLT